MYIVQRFDLVDVATCKGFGGCCVLIHRIVIIGYVKFTIHFLFELCVHIRVHSIPSMLIINILVKLQLQVGISLCFAHTLVQGGAFLCVERTQYFLLKQLLVQIAVCNITIYIDILDREVITLGLGCVIHCHRCRQTNPCNHTKSRSFGYTCVKGSACDTSPCTQCTTAVLTVVSGKGSQTLFDTLRNARSTNGK